MEGTPFANYVRSTAFSLSLNGLSVQNLLFMLHSHEIAVKQGKDPNAKGWDIGGNQAGVLEKRGLIRTEEHGGYVLTPEGVLVAQLLKLAGYKPDFSLAKEYRDQYKGYNPQLVRRYND